MSPQVLDEYDFTGRGSSRNPMYDELMDGQIYRVGFDEIGDRQPLGFRAGLHRAAVRRGKRVRVHMYDDHMVVQAYERPAS